MYFINKEILSVAANLENNGSIFYVWVEIEWFLFFGELEIECLIN